MKALALRCVALHASLPGTASGAASGVDIWNFFRSVLAEQLRSSRRVEPGAEGVIFQCVAFLIDSILQGKTPDAQQASIEVCHAVAKLLADASTSAVRHEVALRICTLLTFQGLAASGEDAHRAAQCWTATWLLVQAFAQVESPAAGDAVQAAVFSGRVLRFFASLRSLSCQHLEVLASAIEGFLTLDLWRLGHLLPMVNDHPTVLALPRLVRFVSRELSCFNGVVDEQIHWLQCLWRPLSLVCLETTPSVASDARLPEAHGVLRAIPAQALLATFSFPPAAQRSAVASEVAWVINRCMEKWGSWNRSKAVAPAVSGAVAQTLRDLMERLSLSAALAEDWEATYQHAEARRSRLRKEICSLGVDPERVLRDLGCDGGPHKRPAKRAKTVTSSAAGRGGA
ncbi:Hypothetical protein (Fragment) [Durusdinium trenchii]|uniref:Uncharacterized protein n=1 Tax=Durusdinium trenchii TaxID=1381693 RepID=A0ABP0JP61_9DINO